jgi:hypothetical protein
MPPAVRRQAPSGARSRVELAGIDYKLLAIYLNDHLAGATGGLELVRRVAGNNRGSELGAFLAKLTREIEQDRKSLVELMERLDLPRDRMKVVVGWAAEKVGRLKLNGRWTSYSPLSRLVELEALVLGVRAKRGLWDVMREITGGDARLATFDFDALAARASAQHEELERHRVDAAAVAFAEEDPASA